MICLIQQPEPTKADTNPALLAPKIMLLPRSLNLILVPSTHLEFFYLTFLLLLQLWPVT